ncbi:glycerophosphoryl diester phosphodiesterase [Rhizocola hellebori]|uniref:Glycerophosphoryl diester phosphodiesterase n=1 Tax=Rhizocola hellebori TaxID=1392758 RepID=A0A8J3QBP5_9ACTN|nr:esterase-like activity of phytase family protein [Rhizocola hellebori]GIH06606.1 glycerophosphoryl diester phosphodiesterase [Rhizocola hellebori]
MVLYRWTAPGLMALTLAFGLPSYAEPADGSHAAWGQATLTGFASLPAQTFVSASEPSGSALGTEPVNGVPVPFADQPVQGFSGIVRNLDGSFDVLSDNGYGSQANSADFVLRIQRIMPSFESKTVDVVGGLNLTDPAGHVAWPLTRPDRVLTGSDFDPESMVKLGDGSYWMGDEFGPYLLHFDRAGRLLAPPVPLDGVYSPQSAARLGVTPNLGNSRGFEGVAVSRDGRYLYPMLEGTVTGDTPGTLRINQFDTRANAYTSRRWTYPLESPDHSAADFVAVGRDRFAVIERDGLQGEAAQFKRIYLIDLSGTKTMVADLLNIADPLRLGGSEAVFRFPFFTIEAVIQLDDRTLGVLNDNNFPSSSGRTPGLPDNNEFITIRLSHKL